MVKSIHGLEILQGWSILLLINRVRRYIILWWTNDWIRLCRPGIFDQAKQNGNNPMLLVEYSRIRAERRWMWEERHYLPGQKKKGKRFQRRTASQLSIESRTSLSGEVSGLQQSHSSQDRTKKRPKIETRLHSVQPRPVQLQLGVNRSQLGQLDS